MCEQVTSLSVRQYGVVIVLIKWNFIYQDSGKGVFTLIAANYFYVYNRNWQDDGDDCNGGVNGHSGGSTK